MADDDLPYVFEYGPTGARIVTARDVVIRAARRVKIVEGEESLTAAELHDGLQLLNDLMHGFGPMGIKYAHVTLGATDPVNMPNEQIRNLILLFAAELAIDFGAGIEDTLAREIIGAKHELQAAYTVVPAGSIAPALWAYR